MKKPDRDNESAAQRDTVQESGARNCAGRAANVSRELERLRSEIPIGAASQFANLDEATRRVVVREISRRRFLAGSMAVVGGAVASQILPHAEAHAETQAATSTAPDPTEVNLNVNGRAYALQLDPRASLLDTLRDELGLTGAKKGCNQGTCGACTVRVDGERVLSCLSLALMTQGREVTTIEGLSDGDALHPLQDAFIRHDAFQCGYCTSGQIVSGEACIREGNAGSGNLAVMSGFCRLFGEVVAHHPSRPKSGLQAASILALSSSKSALP